MPQMLHVVYRKEATGNDDHAYVAQCLEYDIAAQGRSAVEAKYALAQTMEQQAILDVHDGKEPFAGIAPAPDFYTDDHLRMETWRLP